MRSFIPALRFHVATGIYDPVVRLATREAAFKSALVAALEATPRERILDLGCGTGTLAIEIAGRSGAAVFGIDADAAIIAQAAMKQARAEISVRWVRGFGQELPFADGAFDAVVSSLFFHHLMRVDKLSTLREARRVLRRDGRLLVADWGRPANTAYRMLFLAVQALDGFATTRDSLTGTLLGLMAEAGFQDVRAIRRFGTPVGTLELYRATAA